MKGWALHDKAGLASKWIGGQCVWRMGGGLMDAH